jgi:ribonuclease HI
MLKCDIWECPQKTCYLFTDGSCNPNNKSEISRGGYSVIFTSNLKFNKKIYGSLDISECNASNIRAEGFAIIRGMEIIIESNDESKNGGKLCEFDELTEYNIVTDCQFWINMLYNYLPTWDSDKFDMRQNPDLTKRIWKLWRQISMFELISINLLHIKSHNKSGWKYKCDGTYEKWCYTLNNCADLLCKKARVELEPGKEVMILYE